MKYALAAAAFAASVVAQGGPFDLTPDESATGSCSLTFTGALSISSREENEPLPPAGGLACGVVVATLTQGNLIDNFRRTGSVVANDQFQFDGPPQAGVKFDAGFSYCTDGNRPYLKLGDSAEFWNCENDPTPTAEGFDNIYFDKVADYCKPATLYASECTPQGGLNSSAQYLQAGRCGLAPYLLEDPNAVFEQTAYPSDCPNAPDPSATASSGSSSSSASASTSASSTLATSSSTMSTSSAETVAPVPAPAPASNGTSAASGTGVGASPTGPTAVPSPFTGAGSMVAVCKGFVVMVAGAAAFTMS